ncbi:MULTISPECIES: hypothetical protein [unclassified Cryobacterium]|uniref:hypothetical protein n=1 Tax=unclassified Cryobacterium TaxID=2649013 RepID=UPI002AB3D9CC|nr:MULTISPECIES: hypothetical protein [unclassified Cryobacterium]MDY7530020.1 hypothetical protein [Cryobacterium sp. 10C2]MDY7555332.1 hypothetical protein [Cryobacterium sp. 10C3]MEB0292097.1 hypothetical protein [Cryobacterium sp. 10C2]
MPDTILTSPSAHSAKIALAITANLRRRPREIISDPRLTPAVSTARIEELYRDEILPGLLNRDTILVLAPTNVIQKIQHHLSRDQKQTYTLPQNSQDSQGQPIVYNFDRYLQPQTTMNTKSRDISRAGRTPQVLDASSERIRHVDEQSHGSPHPARR